MKNTFRSKFEGRVWANARKKGWKIEYEPDTIGFLSSVVGGACGACGSSEVVKKVKYTPDFKLCGWIYVESKGKFDSKARSRLSDFLDTHGARYDIRILFQRDNWTTKRHRERYSDWCERKGVKYAVGEEIPEEWYKEALDYSNGTLPKALQEAPERGRVHNHSRAPKFQPRKRS